jgi:hypothetical protein
MVIYSMHDDDDRHMGSEDSDEDFEPNVEEELIHLARSMRMARREEDAFNKNQLVHGCSASMVHAV